MVPGNDWRHIRHKSVRLECILCRQLHVKNQGKDFSLFIVCWCEYSSPKVVFGVNVQWFNYHSIAIFIVQEKLEN